MFEGTWGTRAGSLRRARGAPPGLHEVRLSVEAAGRARRQPERPHLELDGRGSDGSQVGAHPRPGSRTYKPERLRSALVPTGPASALQHRRSPKVGESVPSSPVRLQPATTAHSHVRGWEIARRRAVEAASALGGAATLQRKA